MNLELGEILRGSVSLIVAHLSKRRSVRKAQFTEKISCNIIFDIIVLIKYSFFITILIKNNKAW